MSEILTYNSEVKDTKKETNILSMFLKREDDVDVNYKDCEWHGVTYRTVCTECSKEDEKSHISCFTNLLIVSYRYSNRSNRDLMGKPRIHQT